MQFQHEHLQGQETRTPSLAFLALSGYAHTSLVTAWGWEKKFFLEINKISLFEIIILISVINYRIISTNPD